MTRVAIVEDHVLFAETLQITLALEGYDVHRQDVSDSSVQDQVLNSLLRARPLIVLLDLDLAGAGDGVRLVQPLTRAHIHVIVLTASTDRARWGECLRFGACTVLSKLDSLDSILATIRRVSERRPVLAREERLRLVGEFNRERAVASDTRRKLALLTPRERAVLAHLTLGRPVREIALASFVSEETVRTQVKSILSKLEVTSQLAAVGAARMAGWHPPESLGGY